MVDSSQSSTYAKYNGSRTLQGYTITTQDVMTNSGQLQFKKQTGSMTISREDNKPFTISDYGALTLTNNTLTNTTSNVIYCTIKLTLSE